MLTLRRAAQMRRAKRRRAASAEQESCNTEKPMCLVGNSERTCLLLLVGAIGAGKSSVATKLRNTHTAFEFIELDEIRLQKYGANEKCNPMADFPEAGMLARSAMDAGMNTVVIDALPEMGLVELLLGGAMLRNDLGRVSTVWLQCSIDTALYRKEDLYSRAVIEAQHRRYVNRVRMKGELVIATDEAFVDEVTAQVLQHFQRCCAEA